MEVDQMQRIETTKKNEPKKEKKPKKEKTKKKNEIENSNKKNMIEKNTIIESKTKFNKEEISNIIKQHLIAKAERYKIIPPLKIKKSRIDKSKNRISFSNLNDKIQYEKINRKLLTIINIKRVKTNPIMIFFDKWFDKTYQLKKNKISNKEKDKNKENNVKKKGKKPKKQKKEDLSKDNTKKNIKNGSKSQTPIKEQKNDSIKFKNIPINETNHVFDEFSITQDEAENNDDKKSLKKKLKRALHLLRKVIRNFKKRNSIKTIEQCRNYLIQWKEIAISMKNNEKESSVNDKKNKTDNNKLKRKKLKNLFKKSDDKRNLYILKNFLKKWNKIKPEINGAPENENEQLIKKLLTKIIQKKIKKK